MPIDYGTAIGQVRLLIPDVDEANLLLTDEQITAHLALEGGNVKLATAAALEAIASSEVLISKVIKTQDVSTDGARVSAELRARASELRSRGGDDGTGLPAWSMPDPGPSTAEMTEGVGDREWPVWPGGV